MRRVVVLLAGLAIGIAFAAASDEAAQRERIGRERAAAETRYREAMQDCADHFALTACEERARAERRDTLERLSAQEADLDAARHRRQAEERKREIERNAAPRPSASAPAAVPRPHALPAPTPTPIFPQVAPPASDAAAAAARREAQARERYRLRQQRAAAHKAEVERRNAQEDARRAPAQGLPPAPASASR